MARRLVTRARARAIAPWALLSLLWLVTSVAVGLFGFANDSERVTIGAHAATISPTFDGHATLDLGAVLPRLRIATDGPFGLGVNVDVQETVAGAGTGLLVAVAVATGWALVGSRRRRELFDLVHRHERRLEHRAIVVLVAMLITVASILGPGQMRQEESPPTQWRPLAELLPVLSLY